jgi:RNA polymerase sigma-70 factor, ECF subfamily
LNEKQLLKYLKINKRLAQKAVYEKYADSMFLLCYRYISSREDTEEVVMQGFLKIFENITSFSYQEKGSLNAWIRKIMVNESLMFLRKRKKFEISDDYELTENHFSDDHFEIDTEYLYELISTLPIGYRTVFNMHIIDGISHKEIAETLAISINTSKSQLSKARKLLQNKLSKAEGHYETA